MGTLNEQGHCKQNDKPIDLRMLSKKSLVDAIRGLSSELSWSVAVPGEWPANMRLWVNTESVNTSRVFATDIMVVSVVATLTTTVLPGCPLAVTTRASVPVSPTLLEVDAFVIDICLASVGVQ
jgi:hypothetical protein